VNCRAVLLKRLQRWEGKLIIFKRSKEHVTTCKDYIIGRENNHHTKDSRDSRRLFIVPYFSVSSYTAVSTKVVPQKRKSVRDNADRDYG